MHIESSKITDAAESTPKLLQKRAGKIRIINKASKQELD